MTGSVHSLLKCCMLLFTFCVLHFPFSLSHAGIPEPDTVIHGDVYNTSGGKRIPVTAGRIDWIIKGREGTTTQFELSTMVECLDCDAWVDGDCAPDACNDYGYQLSVPQEALAADAEATGGAVPLTGENRQYDYLAVTVDGTPARMSLKGQYGHINPGEPIGEFLLAGQNRRCHYYRVDLEVAEPLADEDGDGIPDYWETDNNLLPADPADASLDPDEDGWSNLQEYQNNANPNIDNRIPSLRSDPVRTSERGTSQFRLKILDSDTPPESVRAVLTAIPETLSLMVYGDAEAGNHGTQLAVGDAMTLKDMMEGNILLACHGAPVDPVIGISLSDGDHDPVETQATVAVFRPTDAAAPLLWMDAAHFAAGLDPDAVESVLPDRSGLGHDGAAYHYSIDGDAGATQDHPLTLTADTHSGQPAIQLDGAAWIELPYGETIFPDGDGMFIAVFRAAGESDGVLASGPYFEVAVTGSDHPSHPNEIRVSTESETVYGNRPVAGEWVIAMVSRLYGQTRIVTHGLWGGGPWSHPQVRTLGTDPVIGARTEWTRDFTLNDWGFEVHNIFKGDIGEILMYNRQLDPTKGWRVGAYLQAKWFGGVVNDQSDATSGQKLMSASWFEWEKRKQPVDAAYEARTAYARALLDGQGIQEALAAFESLVPDHAPWTSNPPTREEVNAAYDAYRDATIFDYERDFVALYGRETPYVMLGGFGDDDVAGGQEGDVILGGPGRDRLWGLGGADIFIVGDGDEINDFNRDENDRIDLTGLLFDPTRPLSACIRLELVNDPEAEDVHTRMLIDSNGDGSGFDDAEIFLKSVVLRDTDLPGLWAYGHLQTGGVRPQLSLSIEADAAETMEIGGSPGVLKLTFSGPNVSDDLTVPAGLTVPLTFGGDATFGVDYRLEALVYDTDADAYVPVPMDSGRVPVILKPGDKILTIRLIPVADGENELVETARVGLMPKSGHYDLGDPSAVDIRLADGPDEVRIRAAGPTAHESGHKTGQVILSRTGTAKDAQVVRLSIQGTAVNGTDYDFIPSEIRIPAGQVTTKFPVTAIADDETEPDEHVDIFVVQGDGYVVAGPTSVRVSILDATAPLPDPDDDVDDDGLPDEWERQYGLDPAVADAAADPDSDGFANLEEFNCGTDPTNDASVPASPLADAGPDQVAAPGATVKLSGLNSVGVHKEDLFFSWQQIDNQAPLVDLVNADSAHATFAAPQGFTGALTFALTVSNSCAEEATADCVVNVTADGAVPKAKAAETKTVSALPGEVFALDAGLSKNVAGGADGLRYRWTKIQGPDDVTLSDASAVSPTFTTPDQDGVLVFELEVTDENGLKTRDRVTVNVSDAATPPDAAASATPDPANEGTTVSLSAGPAQESVSWRWRQIAGPPAVLSDPMSRTPTFTAPAAGPEGVELTFEATVMDHASGLQNVSEIVVSVVDAPEDGTPDGGGEPDGGGGGCFIGACLNRDFK